MDRLFRSATVVATAIATVLIFISIWPLTVNTQDIIAWAGDNVILAGLISLVLMGSIAAVVDLLQSQSMRVFTETLVGVDRDGGTTQHHVESRIDDMLDRVEKISTYSSAALSKKVEQEILNHYKKALSENITPEIGEEIRKLVAVQVARETEGSRFNFLMMFTCGFARPLQPSPFEV